MLRDDLYDKECLENKFIYFNSTLNSSQEMESEESILNDQINEYEKEMWDQLKEKLYPFITYCIFINDNLAKYKLSSPQNFKENTDLKCLYSLVISKENENFLESTDKGREIYKICESLRYSSETNKLVIQLKQDVEIKNFTENMKKKNRNTLILIRDVKKEEYANFKVFNDKKYYDVCICLRNDYLKLYQEDSQNSLKINKYTNNKYGENNHEAELKQKYLIITKLYEDSQQRNNDLEMKIKTLELNLEFTNSKLNIANTTSINLQTRVTDSNLKYNVLNSNFQELNSNFQESQSQVQNLQIENDLLKKTLNNQLNDISVLKNENLKLRNKIPDKENEYLKLFLSAKDKEIENPKNEIKTQVEKFNSISDFNINQNEPRDLINPVLIKNVKSNNNSTKSKMLSEKSSIIISGYASNSDSSKKKRFTSLKEIDISKLTSNNLYKGKEGNSDSNNI